MWIGEEKVEIEEQKIFLRFRKKRLREN